MSTAKGTFDVKVEPLEPSREADGMTYTRMSIEKQWQGEIEGTSTGQMMTAGTHVEGKMSAGYVAIEHVVCTLGGRAGSFVFQHTATMNRDEQTLSISVVPDSGCGGLAGIVGDLTIEVRGETHFYIFDYHLPDHA